MFIHLPRFMSLLTVPFFAVDRLILMFCHQFWLKGASTGMHGLSYQICFLFPPFQCSQTKSRNLVVVFPSLKKRVNVFVLVAVYPHVLLSFQMVDLICLKMGHITPNVRLNTWRCVPVSEWFIISPIQPRSSVFGIYLYGYSI